MPPRTVKQWLGMREMQARRARVNSEPKEAVMANREPKGNREKRKPKKEKPKDAPVSSLGAQIHKPGGKGK
jgi:hypothetical protein